MPYSCKPYYDYWWRRVFYIWVRPNNWHVTTDKGDSRACGYCGFIYEWDEKVKYIDKDGSMKKGIITGYNSGHPPERLYAIRTYEVMPNGMYNIVAEDIPEEDIDLCGTCEQCDERFVCWTSR